MLAALEERFAVLNSCQVSSRRSFWTNSGRLTFPKHVPEGPEKIVQESEYASNSEQQNRLSPPRRADATHHVDGFIKLQCSSYKTSPTKLMTNQLVRASCFSPDMLKLKPRYGFNFSTKRHQNIDSVPPTPRQPKLPLFNDSSPLIP